MLNPEAVKPYTIYNQADTQDKRKNEKRMALIDQLENAVFVARCSDIYSPSGTRSNAQVSRIALQKILSDALKEVESTIREE